MPKRAKQHVPSEVEAFQAEYMKALNEKFKLRSQLAALMNELEDLRAHNDRLEEDIMEQEIQANTPKPILTPKPPPTPQPTPLNLSTPATVPTPPEQPPPSSPLALSTAGSTERVRPASLAALEAPVPEPKPPPLPPKIALKLKSQTATQTTQPEPPPLFPDNPIKGLPMIIRDFDARPSRISTTTPKEGAKSPPMPHHGSIILSDFDNPHTHKNKRKWPLAKDEDEGIYMDSNEDDDVVGVAKPTTAASTAELEEELLRLRRRFEEITFYAIVIIFAIFAFLLMKEIRILLMGKPDSPSYVRTAPAPPHPPEEYHSYGDGEDINLELKLESKPPASTRTGGSRNFGRSKIVLKPAPPCVEQPPVIEVKCGELDSALKRFDCDECNKNLVGLSS